MKLTIKDVFRIKKIVSSKIAADHSLSDLSVRESEIRSKYIVSLCTFKLKKKWARKNSITKINQWFRYRAGSFKKSKKSNIKINSNKNDFSLKGVRKSYHTSSVGLYSSISIINSYNYVDKNNNLFKNFKWLKGDSHSHSFHTTKEINYIKTNALYNVNYFTLSKKKYSSHRHPDPAN